MEEGRPPAHCPVCGVEMKRVRALLGAYHCERCYLLVINGKPIGSMPAPPPAPGG